VGFLETLLVPLLTLVVGYFVGKLQAEQQRIIEERSRVISELFKLYVNLDERVHSLVEFYEEYPEGSPEEDRRKKYLRAAQSFNELLAYHRRNTIWLSRSTARYMDRFIERYREDFRPFRGDEREVGFAKPQEWVDAWRRFEKESPQLRLALEDEFRGVRGDLRAKLSAARRRSELDQRVDRRSLHPPAE
jgi:hypothetical protein